MDLVVDSLLELFEHLDIRNIILLGYSLGARVAVQTAISNNTRIRRLILESYNPGIADRFDRYNRYQSDLKWAEQFLENFN